MPKSRTLVSLIAIPLLALLIACGGGNDDSPSSSGSSNSGGGTGASGGGDDRAVATQPGGGGSTSNNSNNNDEIDLDNCPALLAFARSAGLESALMGDDLKDFNAANFKKLADNAPREIKAEMVLIADAMGEFFKVLSDLKVNLADPSSFARLSPSDLQKLEAISDKLDTPKLEEASDKVTAYFEARCK